MASKQLYVTDGQGKAFAVMGRGKKIPKEVMDAALKDGRVANFLDGLVPAEKPQLPKLVPVETIELEVMLEPGQTLEEMLKRGEYYYSNPNITSKNFPGEGTTDWKESVKRKIRFVRFGKYISEEERLRFLVENKLRACGPTEAAALGMQHPDFQRTHLCAFPAKFWRNPYGNRNFVYLHGGASRRDARLDWLHEEWYDHWWFAVCEEGA